MDETGAKNPAEPAASADPGSSRMIFTMGGIGLACGMLIVLTFQLTFPVIKKNKAEALERAIFEVVPGAATKAAFRVDDEKLVPLGEAEPSGVTYYACYDDARQLVGVAVEASGQGFQDLLRIIYGYSPKSKAVVGMKVLESKETPGLGDKIMTDPVFRANFDSLSVELTSDNAGITNEIVLVKKGKKTEAWQVESITGATISSRAIATILRKSTQDTAPLVAKNLGVLEGGAQ